jgi:predicted Rossmann fold flavoprotein
VATETAYDAIVIGAGAAGMMCAATAGQRGRRVLLLDHGEQPGAKIIISGGGRCNFTNRETPASRFLSANVHFAKSSLSRYTPADFIALLGRHGIPWHEKALGQLFCDGSARQVVSMLVTECGTAAVDMRLAHRVTSLHRDGRFQADFRPPLSSSRPAACRSRSWAPRASPMTWRISSACRWCRPRLPWCRSPSRSLRSV